MSDATASDKKDHPATAPAPATASTPVIDKNTVALITGGGSGIGLAFAERFLAAGATVIICGRRAEVLQEAKAKHPQLHTLVCDVSSEDDRNKLFETVQKTYPNLNVLVNNAGVQNRPPPLKEKSSWNEAKNELTINVDAPVHLSMLFIPLLLKQSRSFLMNVTSGLAFVPISFMPVYCMTKAALHSFTLSLRQQLLGTSIGVIEIIPPAVQTELGGKGLHTFGVPLDEYADHAMKCIQRGDVEFGYKFSEEGRLASREKLDEMFKNLNTVKH